MTAAIDRVRALVEPLTDEVGVELFDLELNGGVLRITLDKPGGVDLEDITRVTRAVSRALDEADPISGHYTLEVSSPGLERTLRTPAHWFWAVGRQVAVKTVAGFDGERRLTGTVTAADDDAATMTLDDPAGEVLELRYDDVERARTVLDWGPAPKPGRGTKPGKGGSKGGSKPGSKAGSKAGKAATKPKAGAKPAGRSDRNEKKANAS